MVILGTLGCSWDLTVQNISGETEPGLKLGPGFQPHEGSSRPQAKLSAALGPGPFSRGGQPGSVCGSAVSCVHIEILITSRPHCAF